MSDAWPFADPRNVAVITTKRILSDGFPILLVTHDADDGQWQFLDGEELEEEDGRLVSLASMVLRDPTIAELASLPLGWVAWRETVIGP